MNGDTGPGHGPGGAGRPGGHYGGPGPYGGHAGPPGYGPYAGPGGPGRPGGPGGHYGGPGGPGWQRIPQAPKPGVIPLQPLRFGDIIGGVFGTLKRYPKPLYLPLLVIVGISAALFAVLAAVACPPLHRIWIAASDVHDFDPSGTQVTELLGYGGAFLLLAALTLFACYVVSSAVSTTVIRHAVLGRKLTTGQAWNASRPYFWRVALDGLLVTAGGLLAGTLVLGLAVGGAIATGSGVFLAAPMLLVFPLMALTIYIQVRLVLVVPVLVLEKERPIAALRRAWRLNEGAWLRSFGIPYVVNLIGSAVVQMALSPLMAVGGVVVIASQPSAMDGSTSGHTASIGLIGGFYLVVLAAGLMVSVLTMPLTPLTNGLLYLDRRIRRESLDVALAAELGIDLRPTWPPPYPPQYPAPNVAPPAAPTPPADEAPKAPEAPQEPKAPEAPAVPDAPDVPDAPADDAPEEP